MDLEKAPWRGLFERMFKSTKRCLRKVVGPANLFYDEFFTILVEIEAVINSIKAFDLDLDEPSHLLCGRRILINLPDGLAEGDVAASAQQATEVP